MSQYYISVCGGEKSKKVFSALAVTGFGAMREIPNSRWQYYLMLPVSRKSKIPQERFFRNAIQRLKDALIEVDDVESLYLDWSINFTSVAQYTKIPAFIISGLAEIGASLEISTFLTSE